jgi:hypothetical protein
MVLSAVSLGWSSSTAQETRRAERSRTLVPGFDGVEDLLRTLRELLAHVTIAVDAEGRREIIFSRVNLRLVNGLGQTDCGMEDNPIPDCPNGLGNLIVGYNEPRAPDFGETIRTGSHNAVIGSEHHFSRFGVWSVRVTPSVGTLRRSVVGRPTRRVATSPRSAGEATTRPATSSPQSDVSPFLFVASQTPLGKKAPALPGSRLWMVLEVGLPWRTFGIEDVLALVAWVVF